MSGTGKSSVIRELARRGFKAVDTDDGWCTRQPDGRQRWREDAILRLLSTEDADVLFIAGCEENQVTFYPQFDQIVLLTAPPATLLERLSTRTNNSYGKAPEELRRFLDDVESVEPLLRRSAGQVIGTAMSLDEVVTRVLQAVGE